MDLFWLKEEWWKDDVHLTALEKMSFKRDFPDINISNGLYIVRGPRQVGKTSWLKHLLRELCINGFKSDCVYFSCELIDNKKELAEVLKSVRNYKYLFIDEITYVKDWALAIKYSRTGSSRVFSAKYAK